MNTTSHQRPAHISLNVEFALLSITILLLLLLIAGCSNSGSQRPEACVSDVATPQLAISTRPYHLGFTRWPPAATAEGVDRVNKFLVSHADLTALHFDGGVPWPEALQDGPLPEAVMNEWKGAREAIPQNHRLLVSITPLNFERAGLALYWGRATDQPLPAPWNDYALDHPEVKAAYLNYARRVIEYFQPDYLVIGIEVNVAQAKAPAVWEAYKKLHRHLYENLKKTNPDLPILASFTYTHLSGLDGANGLAQAQEIQSLAPYLDVIGLSVYPYGWAYESGNVDPLPDDFFRTALSFGKPLGITESGVPSSSFEAFGRRYEFSEAYQARWIDFLLNQAARHRFLFVVNWAAIDFEELLESFPSQELREFATVWVYTGLERSDRCPKESLAVWDAYLELPYSR